MLTPPENGAGEFPDRKTSQHFPGKTEFPSGATSKIHVHSVHVHVQPPIKIQNHRKSPYKLCLKKACLLCSSPSSALVMGSLFSLGSPILDIHMVKPRLGTGVPRSSESNAPRRGGERGFRGGRCSSCSEEEEGCTGLIKDSRADHVSWLYM